MNWSFFASFLTNKEKWSLLWLTMSRHTVIKDMEVKLNLLDAGMLSFLLHIRVSRISAQDWQTGLKHAFLKGQKRS